MTKSKVSVCMIVYNHVKYIEEAIQGVLMQQTDFDVELIISNDASTDQTHEVISNIISNKRIKFKYFNHAQNKGMMPNFIFALEQCKGEYIALCEGDDYWTDPLKLQKQVDILENNLEYNMCFHEAKIVNDKNELISLFNKNKDITTYNLIDFTKMNFVSTASSMFRNNIILKESFKELSAGDWALHMLNAEKGEVYYIPDCMSAYRIHDGGIWSKLGHDEMILKGVEVMKELDVFFNYKYHNEFQDGIENRTLRLIGEKESPTFKNKILKKINYYLKTKLK